MKRWLYLGDNCKRRVRRKETLTDHGDAWDCAGKGNKDYVRQQKEKGEESRRCSITVMYVVVLKKWKQGMCLTCERERWRERKRKTSFVRSDWWMRWWCCERKQRGVTTTEGESDMKTKKEPRAKHHTLQFKPCKTEWWSGTSTTQSSAWANPSCRRRGASTHTHTHTRTHAHTKKHSVPHEGGEAGPLGKHRVSQSGSNLQSKFWIFNGWQWNPTR